MSTEYIYIDRICPRNPFCTIYLSVTSLDCTCIYWLCVSIDLEICPFALLLNDTWLNMLCFQTPGFLKLFLWKSEFSVYITKWYFHSTYCTYYVTVTHKYLVYIRYVCTEWIFWHCVFLESRELSKSDLNFGHMVYFLMNLKILKLKFI